MPLALAVGATCVREGIDDPRKLALKSIARGRLTRTATHASFVHLEPQLPGFAWNEKFAIIRARVEEAYQAVMPETP
jgi:hypothetical protein